MIRRFAARSERGRGRGDSNPLRRFPIRALRWLGAIVAESDRAEGAGYRDRSRGSSLRLPDGERLAILPLLPAEERVAQEKARAFLAPSLRLWASGERCLSRSR